MSLFEIFQKIDIDFIEDELLDIDTVSIGYVEDEFFAQEFCNTHEDCSYGQVPVVKYPIYLEGKMIYKKEDVGLLKIPYKKIDED